MVTKENPNLEWSFDWTMFLISIFSFGVNIITWKDKIIVKKPIPNQSSFHLKFKIPKYETNTADNAIPNPTPEKWEVLRKSFPWDWMCETIKVVPKINHWSPIFISDLDPFLHFRPQTKFFPEIKCKGGSSLLGCQ